VVSKVQLALKLQSCTNSHVFTSIGCRISNRRISQDWESCYFIL